MRVNDISVTATNDGRWFLRYHGEPRNGWELSLYGRDNGTIPKINQTDLEVLCELLNTVVHGNKDGKQHANL